jgi:hypothetical protein
MPPQKPPVSRQEHWTALIPPTMRGLTTTISGRQKSPVIVVTQSVDCSDAQSVLASGQTMPGPASASPETSTGPDALSWPVPPAAFAEETQRLPDNVRLQNSNPVHMQISRLRMTCLPFPRDLIPTLPFVKIRLARRMVTDRTVEIQTIRVIILFVKLAMQRFHSPLQVEWEWLIEI